MKTLIIYSSKNGTTKKCSDLIRKGLNHDSKIINLKELSKINIDLYENIILGSSVYAGNVNKEMLKFCKINIEKLNRFNLGLFLCCSDQENLHNYFNQFPKEIIENSKLFYCGGEINFEEHNFIVKTFLKKLMKDREKPQLKLDTIEEISNHFNKNKKIS